jgi:Ca2+-binding RTX toxin-like protein
VTDANGDVSAASAAWIEGTSGNNSFAFNSELALAPTTIFGNGGIDTIVMSAAVTLIDVDFANVHGVQHLQLTGSSSVTLGADAVNTGINTVSTGSGATSVTDSAGSALAVNAAALANNTALTLSGSTAESVTGLVGDISASGLTGALTVTSAQNTVDHGIAITTGSAATSITDNFSTDTVKVNASALTNNAVLTLVGAANDVVTGLIGDVSATGLTGSLTVTTAQNNVDDGILIHTGSGTTSITDSFSTDTVTVIGTSGSNTIIMSGSANFLVTGAGGADTLTGGSGHNTYVYAATTDSTPSSHDTVTNFHVASDKIDFSAISGLNSNTQPVTMNFLTSTPTSIGPHTIDVVTIVSNTVVYADASGKSETLSNGHDDMQINLTGVTSPTLSDFILHH